MTKVVVEVMERDLLDLLLTRNENLAKKN